MHNRPRTRAYIIGDRELLAQVLTETVREDYGGSLRAGVEATNRAAKEATGGHHRRKAATVNYSTAHRAMNPKPRAHGPSRLTASTFAWLTLFVGPSRHARLKQAVISPAVQLLLDRQRVWEAATLQSVAPAGERFRLQAALSSAHRSARLGLLFEMLRDHRELIRDLTRFNERASKRGHSAERIGLALLQLVIPFLRAGGAESLERTWEEMSPAEQKSYVRLTLRREELLLRRPPDLQRAQAVVAGA